MAVVEQVCGARVGGSLLHYDYSNISHIEINLPINVEVGDCRRSKHSIRREWEDLVVVTEGIGIWEEQIVRELVFQVRIKRILWFGG